MLQEDLMSKLMQWAELVAEREELDELCESFRRQFGQEFLIYIEGDVNEYKWIQEINFYRSMLKQVLSHSKSESVSKEIS